MDATHHGRDLSGLGSAPDPAAPRLFSPPLFVAASPRFSLVRDGGLAGRVELDAGPALQVTAGLDGSVRVGGDVRAALVHRVGDALRLSAEARAERIAGAYSRLEATAAAAVLF
jgi:hypothetical protein